jgi:putative transposase
MSHSYSSNRIHLVFSTKRREKGLPDEFQPKLWAYMAGIARNNKFKAIQVGGFSDHVHALLLLPAVLPLAKAVQLLKGNSSKWINETKAAGADFAWQEGYGAFSVGASQTQAVVRYIRNQAAHHAKRSFEDEFVALLKKYEVSYDPQYVFG